jgi:hypothetical protein
MLTKSLACHPASFVKKPGQTWNLRYPDVGRDIGIEPPGLGVVKGTQVKLNRLCCHFIDT